MEKNQRNILVYRLVQFLSWIVSTFIFRRKILRNEVKGKKGPFAIIANHQASLDFVNLIGVTRRPITFVISQSIYNSSPVKWFMTRWASSPSSNFKRRSRICAV